MDVTVLGAGLMGAALVRTLTSAGRSVGVWNRTPAKAEALRDAGAEAFADLDEAISASDAVVVCLGGNDDVIAALNGRLLAGKTVVNLTTGSPIQAEQVAAALADTGAAYLDGAILCYPADVGGESAVFVVSGPADAWHRVAELLAPLGALDHVGDRIAQANTVDGALVHLFHIPALVSYVEAAAAVLDAGVTPERLRAHTERMLRNFVARTASVSHALAEDDFSTTQAVLGTYARSARTFTAAYDAAGVPAEMLRAASRRLDAAEAAGLGELAIASLARPEAQQN